jgi:Xaa-Pro aminopeptidase
MPATGFDADRLHEYRRRRLRDAMAAQDFDAIVLLGATNAEYAGASPPVADAMRMHFEPVVVVVPASGPFVVCTRFPEELRPGNGDPESSDVVHPAIETEYPEGVAQLAALVRDVVPSASRIGFDEFTSPMIGELDRLLPGVEIGDATTATAAARLIKSSDEIACLREAQRINELAMYDIEAALVPGVRQNELSARFLHRCFELGATASIIDPIWSITPRSVADGTYTANGDVGFPLASNDRFLREGDLILCDSGISWNGYHSDFGKTWICSLDPKPTPGLRDCYRTWQDLYAAVVEAIKPGATCGDLVRAAMGVETKYGLAHFYLGHGVGCDSAEAPFIGSDLGLAFDDTVELAPGMVFVLEPVVWRDGVGGYRSEEVIAVTESGFEQLTRYGYSPFE